MSPLGLPGGPRALIASLERAELPQRQYFAIHVPIAGEIEPQALAELRLLAYFRISHRKSLSRPPRSSPAESSPPPAPA